MKGQEQKESTLSLESRRKWRIHVSMEREVMRADSRKKNSHGLPYRALLAVLKILDFLLRVMRSYLICLSGD